MASVRSDDTVKKKELFFKPASDVDRKHQPNLGALRQAAEFPISQEIIKNKNNLLACDLQHDNTFPS